MNHEAIEEIIRVENSLAIVQAVRGAFVTTPRYGFYGRFPLATMETKWEPLQFARLLEEGLGL